VVRLINLEVGLTELPNAMLHCLEFLFRSITTARIPFLARVQARYLPASPLAGVHYRSGSINGLFVDEEQALGLLCDYSRTYNERFDGFILSTLRGERVRVANGELKSA
jgi:hypothetical protein